MSAATLAGSTTQSTRLSNEDGAISTHLASRDFGTPGLLASEWTKTRRRARYRKSRDGCLNCKAKHRKCDEKVPSCTNCIQRQLTCEYRKDLTWKEFSTPKQPRSSTSGLTGSKHVGNQAIGLDSTQPGHDQNTIRDERSTRHGSEHGAIETVPDLGSEETQIRFIDIPDATIDCSLEVILGRPEHAIDFDTLFSDINVSWPSQDQVLSGLTNNNGTQSEPTAIPPTFLSWQPVDLGGADAFFDTRTQPDMPLSRSNEDEDNPSSSSRDGLGAADDQFTSLSTGADVNRSSAGPAGSNILSLIQQPSVHNASPENIALLFDRRVCEVLCIREELSGNPWRKIVWPLAQEYPALYHAIAAMTCFHGYNRLPQVRAEGVRHFHKSMRSLKAYSDSRMSLEVVLIVTLALGLARSWYHPRASNGIKHIQQAKSLLQDAVSRNISSQAKGTDHRLGFIANTWIYMDVITRLTCQKVESVDFNLMVSCNQLNHNVASRSQIDPLMGYAGSLFPLIGRVADLVKRVRRTKGKLNSPATVSLAVELMTAIERWIPSISSETEYDAGFLTSSTTDLVQTANSYKWAALLLLCQAVPEIPSRLLPSTVAQKVLIFIATVPLDSRAVIFHVFPLMIAGCEATTTEDRDWVRARWQSLSSTGNSSGIVERCIELTSEVWRRCDIHNTLCEMCQNPDHLMADVSPIYGRSPGIHFSGDEGTFNQNQGDHGHEGYDQCMAIQPTIRFEPQDSTVFTFHQASTRALRCTEHTVRSKLHWLTVMEEWGWEG